MCLCCCDMLCWFSFITCCGCRDMVTRKLVFFPPDPYYDHIDVDEDFDEFYQRLLAAQQDEDDEKESDDDAPNNGVVLEVGPRTSPDLGPKSITGPIPKLTEMEALNSSDDLVTDSNLNGTQQRAVRHPSVNANTFGQFRTVNDEADLALFYKTNYGLKMSNFQTQYLVTKRGETISSYYIKNPSPSATYTVLFSHGDAADIGLMRNHLCRMYQKCKVSVFGMLSLHFLSSL